MPVNTKRLRLLFAATAVLLIAVVAGSYFYARYRVRMAIRELPKKLGADIRQSTEGFTYSQSVAGRTLFTIHASKMVQLKQGERAQLHDVKIIVYGRQANRFDQIYGSQFDYDPGTGIVRAVGDVHIDLQADSGGATHPDQATPQELSNPIHLKTSGLEFNQKTGAARTAEMIEFRTPQASGAARGAFYDSKEGRLTLESQIVVHTSGKTVADVHARHGVITKEPLEATFDEVSGTNGSGDFTAGNLRVFFREDGTVERALAGGEVRASRGGTSPAKFEARSAELFVTEENAARNAVISGNVRLDAAGAHAMHLEAGRLLVSFKGKNLVEHVKALENVKLTQGAGGEGEPASAAGKVKTAESKLGVSKSATAKSASLVKAKSKPGVANPQSMQLATAVLDVDVKDGRLLERAYTTGAAEITIWQPQTAGAGAAQARMQRTVVTAGRFDATFDARNRPRVLHGAPDARLVSSTPGQPDRVTTSREIDVAFVSGGTGIASIQQQGDFRYVEGPRRATAEKARYGASDDIFLLTGQARYTDSGLTLSSDSLRLNRSTGDVTAEGSVKTTYTDQKPQGGALLASGNPVHVTAAVMTANRTSGVARYSGGARLWQDANIVEAPTIEFDREKRSMVAQGASPGTSGNVQQRVTTVFAQTDKSGKVTPVNVTAARLTYADSERRARFTGGVVLRSADVTVTADHADVVLQARAAAPDNAPKTVQPGGAPAGSGGSGPSQLQQIIAEGHIVIQEPKRKATGEKLVYTAQEAKFVLTGGPASIFDAERGTITGNSLTFFTRDDRVLVESSAVSRTVTPDQSH
jgi:lipopolysaccharide export system protein LptA